MNCYNLVQQQQTLFSHQLFLALPLPPLSMQLWDVGGSAMEGRMLDKYIYGANAILLVYDVSNHNSFENLEGWLMACKKVRVEWTLK